MIDPFDRPPARPITFEAGDTVILCEGFDECAMLGRLCDNWSRPPKIGKSQNGMSDADEIMTLADQTRKDRVATVGLVFDAEDGATTRRRQIVKWLRKAGFKPPTEPLKIATSNLDGTTVKTAYLINPHGQSRGAIESLFIPQMKKAKHWPCVESLLGCFAETNPSQELQDKIMVRTFIAHRNGRNTGLNAAFNARILNCDDKSFDAVRRFLKLLQRASPIERRAKKSSKT